MKLQWSRPDIAKTGLRARVHARRTKNRMSCPRRGKKNVPRCLRIFTRKFVRQIDRQVPGKRFKNLPKTSLKLLPKKWKLQINQSVYKGLMFSFFIGVLNPSPSVHRIAPPQWHCTLYFPVRDSGKKIWSKIWLKLKSNCQKFKGWFSSTSMSSRTSSHE